MGFLERPAAMLRRARAIAVPRDDLLAIPPRNPKEGPSQAYPLFANDRFHVLTPDKRMYAELVVLSAYINDNGVRILCCQNVHTGRHVDLSEGQLAELDAAGLFRSVKPHTKGNLPRSPVSLDDVQTAIANRNKGYVMAAIAQAQAERKPEPKGGTFNRAIAKYAKEIGDENPPTYVTVRKYYIRFQDFPDQDLRSFLPPTSSGNKDLTYAQEFVDLVGICVMMDKGQGSPNLAQFKAILAGMLTQPEYAHLYDLAFDDEKNWRPSDSWFYKKRAALNRYDDDRVFLGPDTAANRRRKRASRPREVMALGIVDVDYTEVNVMVFDARYKFVYGRPKIIFFRDRATGAILGFSVFFDFPSFEAFWHGFKQAIFPKDMSRYPGLFYPMFGFPIEIVVDNDASLISEAAEWLCNNFSIRMRKARVKRPTDKAGVEQAIAKVDRQVIHNLPGAVENSPKNRDRFDETKKKGIPVITLEVLEARIMHYVCNHVHNRALPDFDRKGKTINQLWADSIAKAPPRPPIDPEELVRIGGFKIRVYIWGGNTIRWRKMEYFSYDLMAISDDPAHRDAEYDGEAVAYDGHVDPSDISKLIIINPYDRGSVIEVPISDKWREYATGRRYTHHDMAIKRHNEIMRTEIEGPSDLERALSDLNAELLAEIERSKTQPPKERFLAFNSDLNDRTVLGRIVDVPRSPALSSSYLDPENPVEPGEVRRSTTAVKSVGGETPDMSFVEDGTGEVISVDPLGLPGSVPPTPSSFDTTVDEKDVDMDALRKQYGWDQ